MTASDATPTGLIIVDHGSRRVESNESLEQLVADYAAQSAGDLVEPAHMELAEPSIATAFSRCVERGAKRVVCFPFFLAPGRHWHRDIPELVAAAAADHPGIPWLVTAPIGQHPALFGIINDRIAHCSAHAAGNADACPHCQGTDRCQFKSS